MLPILTIKLRIPGAHSDTISRLPLLQKLNDGLWETEGAIFSRHLTLVAASAGYGKTTLLSDWVGHLNTRVAWISLDETDYEPVRFLQYLIASLQQKPYSNLPKRPLSQKFKGSWAISPHFGITC